MQVIQSAFWGNSCYSPQSGYGTCSIEMPRKGTREYDAINKIAYNAGFANGKIQQSIGTQDYILLAVEGNDAKGERVLIVFLTRKGELEAAFILSYPIHLRRCN